MNILTVRRHPEGVARIKRQRVAARYEGGAAAVLLHVLKVRKALDDGRRVLLDADAGP